MPAIPTNTITCSCPVRIGRKEMVAYSINNPSTTAPKRVLSRISGSIKNEVKVLTNESAKGLIEKNFDSILSSLTSSFAGEGMVGSRSIGDLLYAVMGKYTQGIYGNITGITGIFTEGELITVAGNNYRLREFDNVNNTMVIDNLDENGANPLALSTITVVNASITGLSSGASATFDTQGILPTINQFAHIYDVAQNNCHPKMAFYRFGCLGDDGSMSTNKDTSYITEGHMIDKFEIDFEAEKRLNFKLDTKGTELKNLDPAVLTGLFTPTFATGLENFAQSQKSGKDARWKDEEINFVSCNAMIYLEPINTTTTIYQAIAIPVKSLKLMINKNLQDDQTIGTGGCGERFIYNKEFEADGELETFNNQIPLKDIGKTDYRARIVIKPSGLATQYPVSQTGNVMPQIEIDIPKVSFSAWSESDNLNDIITQSIKFVCSYQTDSTANSNMPRSIRFIVKNDVIKYPTA